MNETSPFQKSVGETLVDLSEFLKKINPNPFVAIAAFEIYKSQIISWSIFDMDTRQSRSIMSHEVIELVSALEEFFETFATQPIYIATALEMTKLVANNRLALAISFSNEIFLACEEMKKQGIDIDIDFVIKSMSIDPRIGKYGSVFRKAWGGPCFLKDTVALETFTKSKTGKSHNLISGSIEINKEMKDKYGVRE